MKKREFIENGRLVTFQEQQLRCGKCDEIFGVFTEVNVSIDRFLQQMMAICCPRCQSTEIFMGQSRTLAEDQRFESSGPVERRARQWLDNGELGTSSLAIRAHMTGERQEREVPAPRDTADLRRCILLLKRIPEWVPRMGEMASYPEWVGLAPEWDSLMELFLSEVGSKMERVPAPRTAERMESLRGKGV